MKNPSKITFLGTGTSQGVPMIACKCTVCVSENEKDKRLRSSLLITDNKGSNIVVDTGPDFRQQMLREHVTHLEGIVYTHEHKDHIAGMDDVRAFNFAQKQAIDLFGNTNVLTALKREFAYAFGENRYPGVPEINLTEINGKPFSLGTLNFIPIEVMHYKLPVYGYRIGNFAYITDANFISTASMNQLKGLDVLVLNALRHKAHISHFTLEEALAIIETLRPKQTYLTHISHQLGLHDEVSEQLPANVALAYDGLTISF